MDNSLYNNYVLLPKSMEVRILYEKTPTDLLSFIICYSIHVDAHVCVLCQTVLASAHTADKNRIHALAKNERSIHHWEPSRLKMLSKEMTQQQ